MKLEKYEAPKAVVVNFESDYVMAYVGSGSWVVGHSGGGGAI